MGLPKICFVAFGSKSARINGMPKIVTTVTTDMGMLTIRLVADKVAKCMPITITITTTNTATSLDVFAINDKTAKMKTKQT